MTSTAERAAQSAGRAAPSTPPAAASSTAPPAPQPPAPREFDLVESSAGWELTITLTDRLRAALAEGGGTDVDFAVRISPNLVPGDPFMARLRIQDAPLEGGNERAGRPRPTH